MVQQLVGGKVNINAVSAGQLGLDVTALALQTPTPVGAMPLPKVDGIGIDSMQYAIQRIQMCEGLETNGSGYGQSTHCVTIYEAKTNADYSTFGYAEAKANTTDYIDLLDAESLKRLSSQLELREGDIGEYNFGLVNWYKPFKIKGSVKLNNGTILYTKDAPIVETFDHNNNVHYAAHIDNITTGPAELGILQHNNGGAWFKFATPFKITRADIEAKRDFQLDLVFNADGIVKGTANGSDNGFVGGAGPYSDLQEGDQKYSIEAPFVGLTPIAHGKDQKIVRDRYTFNYHEVHPFSFPPHDDITEDFDVRIEVYTLKDDPDRHVMGVDIEVLATAQSFRPPGNIYDPFFVKALENGEVRLETYDHKSAFAGFKLLPNVNDTGPLVIKSGDAYCLPSDESTCGNGTVRDFQVTYTLESRTELP